MSTLDKCADALLQQRATQSSNHGQLERQILELERARRSTALHLRDVMGAVQRRRKDLADVRDANVAHDEQLAQGRLKLSALVMATAEGKKRHAPVAAALAAVSDAWMGQPTRVVQVARALQERGVVVRAAAAMAAAMAEAHAAVQCATAASAARATAASRLTLQRAHLRLCRDAAAAHADAAEADTAAKKKAAAASAQTACELRRTLCDGAAALSGDAAAVQLLAHYVAGLETAAEAARGAVASAADAVAAQEVAIAGSRERHRSAVERRDEAAAAESAAVADDEARRQAHAVLREDLTTEVAAATAGAAESREKCAALLRGFAGGGAAMAEALARTAAVARLVVARFGARQAHRRRAAERAAAAAEAAGALAELRRRHEDLLARRHAARQAARVAEAVTGLVAEEALTRRMAITGPEADAFDLLREQSALALQTVRAAAAAAAAAAATTVPQPQRRGRGTAKRTRRTTGEAPAAGETLADELGLAAATGRRTHPVCRVAAMYPEPRKDAGNPFRPPSTDGGAHTPKRAKVERRGRLLHNTADASDLSSPSPRRPAALGSRAPAKPFPRPLMTQAASAVSSTSSALTAALQALPRGRRAKETARPPMAAAAGGDRRPLNWCQGHGKAAPVRATQTAAPLVGEGEDLFSDMFM